MPLLTAIVSSVLVALVGNFLVQKWQMRNWMEQQRLLRAEKQLEDLKLLSNEIMKLGDSRSYRTRRLLLNLDSIKPEELDACDYFLDYKQAVAAWNDLLNSFLTRLTLFASSSYTSRLESRIQPNFVRIGDRVDSLIKVRRLGGIVPIHEKNSLTEELNRLNGRLGNFYRDLLRMLLRMQKEAYIGRKIKFDAYTIDNFSTWYLFKALFQSNHPPITVFSPPEDFLSPW